MQLQEVREKSDSWVESRAFRIQSANKFLLEAARNLHSALLDIIRSSSLLGAWLDANPMEVFSPTAPPPVPSIPQQSMQEGLRRLGALAPSQSRAASAVGGASELRLGAGGGPAGALAYVGVGGRGGGEFGGEEAGEEVGRQVQILQERLQELQTELQRRQGEYGSCQGVLALCKKALKEYQVLEKTAAVAGNGASHAHGHSHGPEMVCDRCLQPIEWEAFQANLQRLQVRHSGIYFVFWRISIIDLT